MKAECATCGMEKEANRSLRSEFSWRKDRNRHYRDCKACRNAKCRIKARTKQTRLQNKEKAAIEQDPHRHLIFRIIDMALVDWRRTQGEAERAFFRSPLFVEYCDLVADPGSDGVDIEAALDTIGVE